MLRKPVLSIFSAAMLGFISPVLAAMQDDLRTLTQRWAIARYQLPAGERKAQLAELVKSADELTRKYPERADGYLWAGVVRCSLAEIETKLHALQLVRDCRHQLEKALAIDPDAEDGYAYGVLGTLYARVPGWPLSFGDKKKAHEFLQKGVDVAPAGMNSNYFYARFLYDQGDTARAKIYIERAMQAAPPYPPEQSLPVAVRLDEIRALHEKIKYDTAN